MVRRVAQTSKDTTTAYCLDEPFPPSGACHVYEVGVASGHEPAPVAEHQFFAHIQFQKGPRKEVGVNGCMDEDLLSIVIDRLTAFQRGEFPCKENDHAINHLVFAREILLKRMARRKAQGVEGRNEPHDSTTAVEQPQHDGLMDMKYTLTSIAGLGFVMNRKTGHVIPSDEPVMVFRAQDRHTVKLLRQYYAMCTDPAHLAVLNKVIDRFELWQQEHPNKVKEPYS